MLRQANQVKLFIGLVAISSIAALTSGVSAQTVRPDASVINRANISVENVKPVQDGQITPAIQRINPNDGKNAWNGLCGNGSCAKRPGQNASQVINPASGVQIERINQPVR